MTTTFLQKRILVYRKHTLFADKVLVETKTLTHTNKYEIKLDKIGLDIQYQAENNLAKYSLFAGVILFLLACTIYYLVKHNFLFVQLLALYFCGIAVLLLPLLKEREDYIFLVGQQNLVFYRDIPSEQKVLEFIDVVTNAVKKHLKNKYLIVDSGDYKEDYLHNLEWLKESNIITEKEYRHFKNEFELKRLL